MSRYVRVVPSRRDSVAAAAVSFVVATAIGTVTFYLTRLLLARDSIPDAAGDESSDAARG